MLKLAVKVGVNIQPGQDLLVRSPIECAPFVRKVVKHAYETGAKNVYIEWSDEECTLIRYLNAPDEYLMSFQNGQQINMYISQKMEEHS